MVMSVYASDSGKDMGDHEKFINEVTQFLQEGRRAGAKFFFLKKKGDLNIELGLLCTGDEDAEDLREMYGCQCWLSCERDPGGFKKMMWYDIMK